MKVVSWNINGLRAVLRSGQQDLRALLDSLGADIICFQETKTSRDQLDETLYLVKGYNAYFSFCQTKKGYSGVVTFCRDSVTPVAAEEGLTGIHSSSQSDSIIKCYGDHSQFTDDELSLLDCEGRAVLTEHSLEKTGPVSGQEKAEEDATRSLVVVNVYCPMYDSDRDKDQQALARLRYKMNFYKLLESRCSALERAGKLVLAVGDFNCCREAIDSAYMLDNPKATKCSQSMEWIGSFAVSQVTPPPPPPSPQLSSSPTTTTSTTSSSSPITTTTTSSSSPTTTTTTSTTSSSSTSTKLLDTFRYLHRDKKGAYTCWNTLLDARKTNYGTRIDYILCSCCLAERVVSSEVWQHVKGSDHCPVFADFELSPRRSDRPLPPLCSMWFAGKQSRLLDFVTRSDKVEKKAEKRAVDPAPSVSAPPAKKKVLGQRSLFSFATSNSSKASTSATPTPEPSSAPNLSQGGGGGLSEAWKGVFGGAGPKAPLCSGHNEACVQRRVKKKGPNKDRQFWVCARPAGSKGDPQARCDFFKWAKEKKK